MIYPDEYYRNIYEIDIDKLKNMGIKGFIIDIDNTLVPWNGPKPDLSTTELIKKWRKCGINICLISNNTKKRVNEFNSDIKCPVVWNAKKPLKSAYIRAARYLDCKYNEVAVIGDQLFTDILGGNKLGMYTILVDPISEKELRWTRLMRRIEKRFKKRIKEAQK